MLHVAHLLEKTFKLEKKYQKEEKRFAHQDNKLSRFGAFKQRERDQGGDRFEQLV